MSIFITNNIEQECKNLISMYTDIGYVKKRILQNYAKAILVGRMRFIRTKVSGHVYEYAKYLF